MSFCVCITFLICLTYKLSSIVRIDVGVFGGIHRRLRGVGLSSIACGYMLVTYYSMLLAWVCNAFFTSFGSDNFWAQDEVTGSEAKNYFCEY